MIGQLLRQLKTPGALQRTNPRSSCLFNIVIEQDDPIYADNPTRSAIIKDLLKNRPSGPASNPITYTESEEWCSKKSALVKKLIPSHKYYGYDKKVLFNLGFRSIEDVRKVLRKHHFEGRYPVGGKKRTYTRQCNLLWRRLEPAIKCVITEGGIGVYRVVHKSVRSAYTLREANIGFVYAVDYKEATNISRLMFGYLVKDPDNIETVFARFGSVDSLITYNTKAIKKIDSRLRDMELSLEYTQDKIKKLKNMKQAVLNVTLSMCSKDDKE